MQRRLDEEEEEEALLENFAEHENPRAIPDPVSVAAILLYLSTLICSSLTCARSSTEIVNKIRRRDDLKTLDGADPVV